MTNPSLDITLNGQAMTLPPGSSLADLLTQLDSPPEAVATAVNGQFVPRGQRAGQALQPGDQITFIRIITGG